MSQTLSNTNHSMGDHNIFIFLKRERLKKENHIVWKCSMKEKEQVYYTHIYMYVHIYMCVCVCIYIYIYIWFFFPDHDNARIPFPGIQMNWKPWREVRCYRPVVGPGFVSVCLKQIFKFQSCTGEDNILIVLNCSSFWRIYGEKGWKYRNTVSVARNTLVVCQWGEIQGDSPKENEHANSSAI